LSSSRHPSSQVMSPLRLDRLDNCEQNTKIAGISRFDDV
jgi:hypothetical protein